MHVLHANLILHVPRDVVKITTGFRCTNWCAGELFVFFNSSQAERLETTPAVSCVVRTLRSFATHEGSRMQGNRVSRLKLLSSP